MALLTPPRRSPLAPTSHGGVGRFETENIANSAVSDATRLLPSTTGRIDRVRGLAILAAQGYHGPVPPKPARVALGKAKRQGLVKEAGSAMLKLWEEANLPADSKPSPVMTKR